MKFRLCALLASTMLSGCVLTDSTNNTGGDFLQEHGASVLPSDLRSFGITNTSVEVVPMEGVPGSHGSEGMVLGSLSTGDSIRLVLGFNLADTTVRSKFSLAHADSLISLYLLHKAAVPSELKVRARFVFLSDSSYLPGVLSGVEPGELEAENADDAVFGEVNEFEITIPAGALADTTLVQLPIEVRNALYHRLAKNDSLRRASAAMLKSWLVVLLDSRAGNSRVVFSEVALVGKDTAATAEKDTSGSMAVGKLYDYPVYRSIGFRPANAPVAMGWWPSGGNRLRVRVDAAKLRNEMHAAFGIATDTAGGFDNSFNILQARISAPFSVVSDESALRRLSINSSVVLRTETLKPVDRQGLTGANFTIPLTEIERAACGLTINPVLQFKWLPGVYQMKLVVENTTSVLPTRLSLAGGSYSSFTMDSSYFRIGDGLEFRISSLVRVRVRSDKDKLHVSYSVIERDPVGDGQYGSNDSLRTEAQLASNASFVRQEVRSPLTQIVNRPFPVDIDLSPALYCTTSCDTYPVFDNSARVIAVPADPSRVFDSVKVVVRPLIGRNN